MAAAAIPSLGPTGPASLKAPATSSTTPESATSVRTQSSNRSDTPQSASRRQARPVSSDFLSNKATTAFIRRTLCPQAERGRDSPAPIEELLPPLTSRNDVDLQLYALISVVLKEFVQKWYANITPDETFVAEIVQIIAHCTRALEQRLRKVDLESLLLDELPELLDAHVRAYRTAQNSAVRPPLETNHREIYHSLHPLPALSPIPKPDDPRSIQIQADNEAAYRQLLVQGVLALVLPTEDLQNECLTSLVGQIFSELIIGNLIANKISEPWMLLEIMIMLTRLAKRPSPSTGTSDLQHSGSSNGSKANQDQNTASLAPKGIPARSANRLFWTLIHWGFMFFTTMRLVVIALVLSPSLPSRLRSHSAHRPGQADEIDEKKSYKPLVDVGSSQAPSGISIVNFSLWACVANLFEVNARMPWLVGALSMLQWSLARGPGKITGYDGIIDRLLSHHIQTHILDPAMLPPLLRSIRAALFPNNAPGTSSLTPPSSDAELVVLRRRCAKAIWALVPKSVGRLYFGSVSFGSSSSSSLSHAAQAEGESSGNVISPETGPNPSSMSTYSNHDIPYKNSIASGNKGSKASGSGRLPAREQPGTKSPLASANSGLSDNIAGVSSNPSEERCSYSKDDEILFEIECGLLDIFSDSYCNKHLMYGILELVLVRLMPELAEKGIIELWEERLS